VITEGDVCRAVHDKGSLTGISADPAFVYASKEPTVFTVDAEISDAFHKMLMSGLTLLPVIDGEKLAGVVLRVDLMQAMLLDADPEA